MTERAEMLAKLISLENGKALRDARGEVAYAAEFFRWNAEEAVRIVGDFGLAPAGANRIIVEYQPIGICVLITPGISLPPWRPARSRRRLQRVAPWCSNPQPRRP